MQEYACRQEHVLFLQSSAYICPYSTCAAFCDLPFCCERVCECIQLRDIQADLTFAKLNRALSLFPAASQRPKSLFIVT